MGVHDSLRSLEWVVQDSLENSEWGCRIPYDSRDFIFPEGIPNFLGGGQILCDTGIYFTAKYGLPLENFDHLPKTQ